MNHPLVELSKQEQTSLVQCQNLFSNNRIVEARQQVSVLLNKIPENKQLLKLAFKIELRCQDFAKAQRFFDLLSTNISKNQEKQLLLIELLEAKEEHFLLLEQITLYLQTDENNASMLFKHGIVAMAAGKIEVAEQSFKTCLAYKDELPHLMLNFGHVYKARGDSRKAVEFYQRFIMDTPTQCGVGYWSMADLKDYVFSCDDKNAMLQLLDNQEVNVGNKALLNFAFARACEQQADYNLAFENMSKANAIFTRYRPFRQDLFLDMVNSMMSGINNTFSKAVTVENFMPIFIVGMPRSGTTLVEQILASHSSVSATDELPYIERIGLELERTGGYVTRLTSLNNDQTHHYATKYRDQVQQYFDESKAVVIDKNPNNFLHIGLIKALFPNAKIINVIRNPLDNGLSVFKQYFSRGHEYSYSMEGILEYWQGYLKLMDHWTNIFGQDIYHLSYEGLTDKPEIQIRKLLDYCALTFEENCLSFHKSDRIVLTPSVSQVRQPINKRSVNSGMKYEQSIAPFLPKFEKIIKQAETLING
jgi:tetratricopeptide (TPR) repeat protein